MVSRRRQAPFGGCGTGRAEAWLGCLCTAAWIFRGREPHGSNVELWQIAFLIRAQGFAVKPRSAQHLSGQHWSGRGFWTRVFSVVKLGTHPRSSHFGRAFGGHVTFWNEHSGKVGRQHMARPCVGFILAR